jgi:hypothetical protein
MSYSDYVIYVDESGDHGLEAIDPDYPVFVLTFGIFEKARYVGSLVPAVQAFKFRHFGHDMVVLHELDIRRQRPPFAFLKSRAKREAFLYDLSAVIAEAQFTVIAAAIKKDAHKRRYVVPASPYDVAMQFCLERAYRFLQERAAHRSTTHVIVERRGKREDAELAAAFRDICAGSSPVGEMDCFDLIFADKKVNSSGMQIADLTARPIGRQVLAPSQPNRAWEIIETKLRRAPSGTAKGWGLKVFP